MIFMNNNDLLTLYCIEKKTFDNYDFWHTIAVSALFFTIGFPIIFPNVVWKYHLLQLWVIDIFLFLTSCFLLFQKQQTNKRIGHIILILLAKNP